jgi:hypothetical protein
VNYDPAPQSDPIREALKNLVNAVLAPCPQGMEAVRERILHTLAHSGREILRGERYDGRRVP